MLNIRTPGTRMFNTLLWCAALGVLFENVILIRQNRELKGLTYQNPINAGRSLRHLSGLALDGTIRPIKVPDNNGTRLVIATFAPGCPFCRQTQPFWTSLSDVLRRHGQRLIWLSRDSVESTRDYCEKAGIVPSDVFADPPNRTYIQLGLQVVPNTIVVGPGGIVEKVWTGPLDESKAEQVLAFLGMHDPAQMEAEPATKPTPAKASNSRPKCNNC
jgi:peroxiredoxin